MFPAVSANVKFPQLEETILAFWKERQIYEKSLEQRADAAKFVFYEGPPTANGMPHPGHCLTRAIKDLFPRYQTMRGRLCERKAGWDTHGLPVEVEVCKELGIHSKEEIEAFGIEPFIHKCQESVWRYMQEWERLTERLGFWIHLDEAYVTYHQSYVESVWWSLKNLFDRGLLYQGHKIVWWWAQGGTALSAGEVGEGYREVADPSVYVRFPLVDRPGTSMLVWTTTPWTLPSNQFVAVHPELDYAVVSDAESNDKLIIAADLVETIAGKVKRELTVESNCKGADLLGNRYVPPFNYYYDTMGDLTGSLAAGGNQHVAWRVVAADFVTTDSGTGLVHQAPAFGEVDYDVLIAEQSRFAAGEGPELICAVAPDGKFTDAAPEYEGRWVKEADKDITREMRDRGVLYHQEQYIHDYPFCPRAEEDALIQYPRRSWFIRTTQFKDRMLQNNQQINWLPEHIQEGRFGNFLESNVDWALSRERYWGTPLPIWKCVETGEMEAVASYAELLAKPGIDGTERWEAAKDQKAELPDDLCVHKPYIDAITYDSPFSAGGRMERVPEVIDCWYDAGAMPFAQWGYPHQGSESFTGQFPADFISEAIDQTRGWFYSLLAISTMLFADEQQSDDGSAQHEFPHPFGNCIVLGLMLAEAYACVKCGRRHLSEVKKCEDCGANVERKIEKMSKRLRNYHEPQQIFDRYGADALRWYFFANQAPWTSIIYSERTIKESIPEFLLRLWNVYSFFVIYANIDGFDPGTAIENAVGALETESLRGAKGYRPPSERSELDRWILSELNRTSATVVERMDAYDNYTACGKLNEFVDALSNWYVRRSRDRFWSDEKTSPDKLDAYWTLYECLTTTSKLIAPFVPFLAENLWQNLVESVFGDRAAESVHLCDFPAGDASVVDDQLSARMQLIREISSLGRSARMNAKLKVRQPLAKVEVILADNTHQPWLEEHAELICEELNVKLVEYTEQAEKYINYQVLPNFKLLGPKLGPLMPGVKKWLADQDGGELLEELNKNGSIGMTIDGQRVEIGSEEIQIKLQAKEGWAAAQGSACVVVLSTELTPELEREGMARDIIRLIQERRKELDCQYTDRLVVAIVASSTDLKSAINENAETIQQETLANRIEFDALDGADGVDHAVSDHEFKLYVRVVADEK